MRGNGASARLGVVLFAGAIMAAPFVAWLYRAEAGLIVMAVGLGATSLLLHEALEAAPPRVRRWLRLVIDVNLLLIVACISLAVWLVVRG